MKTAISIPDPLFEAAERASKRMRVSRSRLYSLAVAAFLKSNRTRGVKEVLDEVYRSEDGRLDPALERMQAVSLPREDW